MLQNINLNPKISNVSNTSNDALIAKNIIDVLFMFIDTNIRNDKKMAAFTKSLILSQLPNIRNGSKDYINEMSSTNIKLLLDNIQNQLGNRK